MLFMESGMVNMITDFTESFLDLQTNKTHLRTPSSYKLKSMKAVSPQLKVIVKARLCLSFTQLVLYIATARKVTSETLKLVSASQTKIVNVHCMKCIFHQHLN